MVRTPPFSAPEFILLEEYSTLFEHRLRVCGVSYGTFSFSSLDQTPSNACIGSIRCASFHMDSRARVRGETPGLSSNCFLRTYIASETRTHLPAISPGLFLTRPVSMPVAGCVRVQSIWQGPSLPTAAPPVAMFSFLFRYPRTFGAPLSIAVFPNTVRQPP